MNDAMQKIKTSKMQDAFMSIAVEAVTPLRKASDKGAVVTPLLVGEVQERFAKVLEQVYYGFHPKLEAKP